MSMSELLRNITAAQVKHHRQPPRKPAPTMDSASSPPLSGADDYTSKDIALKASTAIHQWAETDDLDDGESYADRLLALMIGIADANHDGDITEDEQWVLTVALNTAWDYMSTLGVDDEDCNALLNDWDADAADRVRDLVASVLPDGDEADARINAFVFDDDQSPVFDTASVRLDAAYRKVIAVRDGKKVRINKRISGQAKLSALQKIAIRKAQAKSHSASAVMKRARSMRIRHNMGL